MDAFQAIVLGIVQGLTEFLPISSSGHLLIVPAFLGWEDPGSAFTAVTQLGTMAAVLLYFRKDLWNIARAWFLSLWIKPELRGTLDARMGWYIGLGTLPVGVFGWSSATRSRHGARSLYLVGTTLIVLGLVLLAAEKVATHRARDRGHQAQDAVVIGFAQALALIPGVSRSGATITAGLFRLRPRGRRALLVPAESPAVVLSGLFEMRKIGDPGGAGAIETALATIAAFVVGYAAIAWLLKWLANHSMMIFVVYRVALGALVIALTATGAIEAS